MLAMSFGLAIADEGNWTGSINLNASSTISTRDTQSIFIFGDAQRNFAKGRLGIKANYAFSRQDPGAGPSVTTEDRWSLSGHTTGTSAPKRSVISPVASTATPSLDSTSAPSSAPVLGHSSSAPAPSTPMETGNGRSVPVPHSSTRTIAPEPITTTSVSSSAATIAASSAADAVRPRPQLHPQRRRFR